MVDLDETFVYDSITHAYNMAPSNYRNERHAEGIVGMLAGNTDIGPPEYHLSPEGFIRDWGVEETANMLFRESQTDMSTFQPVPMYAFHDGLVANEKAAAVVDRWPDRFRAYAAIDPLREGWEAHLEDQAEQFDPLGVKLYPSHWTEDHYEGWSMGDPEVAFPVFEKAVDMGIDRIDIHKAIPFGPVPRSDYHPGDVDVAAESFPDIDFSIVHAGVAFAEETAWQLARFPNVYANLENTACLVNTRPKKFARALGEMLYWAGPDRIVFSSGATALHPQPPIDAIWDFEMPEDLRAGEDYPEVTQEDKEKILGKNKLRLMGKDPEQVKKDIKGDKWDKKIQELKERGEYPAPPWSTYEEATEVDSKERVRFV